jgi:hypothetical protein
MRRRCSLWFGSGVVIVVVLAATTAGCGGAKTTPTTATSPSQPANRSPSSSASAAGPRSVVETYWKAIATGRYRAAFRLLDGSEQSRVHGQRRFVADHVYDEPIKVRVRLGSAAVNGHLATVPVMLLQTIGHRTGCHRWPGSYRLREIGSRWWIDAINVHKQSC